jgi:hypothetical protein
MSLNWTATAFGTVFFASTVLLTGCQAGPSGYTTGGEHYDLTPEGRVRLERRAEAGDRSAMLRLREYYMIARHDRAKTDYWRKRLEATEKR